MRIFYLLISAIFLASGLVVANVPAPPPFESKGIEVQKDYPDYVFYFGKYYVFEEKGKSISKIDLEKIELTNLRPFAIKKPKNLDLQYFKEKNLNPDQVKISVREDYLIAVKKEINNQVESKLSQKMIELINLKKNGDGIYFASIPERGEINNPNDIHYGSYRSRMIVSSLDEDGLKFSVPRFQEGDNHYLGEKEAKQAEVERNTRTITFLVGIGLGISALILAIGIFILRKKQKVQSIRI